MNIPATSKNEDSLIRWAVGGPATNASSSLCRHGRVVQRVRHCNLVKTNLAEDKCMVLPLRLVRFVVVMLCFVLCQDSVLVTGHRCGRRVVRFLFFVLGFGGGTVTEAILQKHLLVAQSIQAARKQHRLQNLVYVAPNQLHKESSTPEPFSSIKAHDKAQHLVKSLGWASPRCNEGTRSS